MHYPERKGDSNEERLSERGPPTTEESLSPRPKRIKGSDAAGREMRLAFMERQERSLSPGSNFLQGFEGGFGSGNGLFDILASMFRGDEGSLKLRGGQLNPLI